MTQKNSRSMRRLAVNRVGIFVLLLGLVCAGTVYWTGENRLASHSHDRETVDDGSRDDTLSFEDSKASSRGTEVYFGKVGVLMTTWIHHWKELKDSERFAIMIALGSVLASSICFLAANRWTR
jgi:hypothetical protein